jgi:hypothetical protein
MSEPVPRLRIVGSDEATPRRPRGPGIAVILVGIYGLLFGGALWWLRGQAPGAGRPAAPASVPSRAKARVPADTDRRLLLAGFGLEPEAVCEYDRQLAADCCDCGCDLTLQECLVADQKCARSAEAAREKLRRLQ